ncbi:MAG: metallopeptidase family protein [bacterium]|nr:metallopeptidase family protein [bacterium]
MNDLDPIEIAGRALADGDPHAALTALEALPANDADRNLIACVAHLELGAVAPARAAFAIAERGLGADDTDLALARAELLLAEWQPAEARRELEALAKLDRGPDVLCSLALCLELDGELDAADQLFAEAARNAPEEMLPPLRLGDADFDAVVSGAIEELPPEFRAPLENVRIVKEPMPFPELVDRSDPGATPPELLGLFVGPTLHDLADGASAEHPPVIYLFQRNLERMANDREHLAEEIRLTLYHEIGHLLGLDEDEVDAMGLG